MHSSVANARSKRMRRQRVEENSNISKRKMLYNNLACDSKSGLLGSGTLQHARVNLLENLTKNFPLLL